MSCYDRMLETLGDGVQLIAKQTQKCLIGVGTGVVRSVVAISKVFLQLVQAAGEVVKRDLRQKKEVRDERERRNREWFEHLQQALEHNLSRIPMKTGLKFQETPSSFELSIQLDLEKQKYFQDVEREFTVFLNAEYLALMDRLNSVDISMLDEDGFVRVCDDLKKISQIEQREREEMLALIYAIRGEEYVPERNDITSEQAVSAFQDLLNKLIEFEGYHRCQHSLLGEATSVETLERIKGVSAIPDVPELQKNKRIKS